MYSKILESSCIPKILEIHDTVPKGSDASCISKNLGTPWTYGKPLPEPRPYELPRLSATSAKLAGFKRVIVVRHSCCCLDFFEPTIKQ